MQKIDVQILHEKKCNIYWYVFIAWIYNDLNFCKGYNPIISWNFILNFVTNNIICVKGIDDPPKANG